jgi:hypothetical protein
MSNSALTKPDRFWRGFALAALLGCFACAFMHFAGPARADNGGASNRDIIAMMGNNAAREHLYLIDTSTQTILMYENMPGAGFSLVAGRSYAGDEPAVNKLGAGELPYKAQGYAIKDIAQGLGVAKNNKGQ